MPGQRAQRNTLTYSQMYGSGMDARGLQEGKGIFDSIGNFLKSTKIISTIGKIAAPLVGIINPAAGAAVAAGATLAGQLGVGLPKKIKNLSSMQMQALKEGFGKALKSGGISFTALAKKKWPAIKNITSLQMKAVAAFRGRHMKGGGISLAGGRASGMRGMGFSGMGVKLAGTGVTLAGMGHLPTGAKPKTRKRGRPKVRLGGGRMHGGQVRAQVCPPQCPLHGVPMKGGLNIAPFVKAASRSKIGIALKKKLVAKRKAAGQPKMLMARA